MLDAQLFSMRSTKSEVFLTKLANYMSACLGQIFSPRDLDPT